MTILIVISLILLSALFSGLTLGFMSLSKDELERKIKLGVKRAENVYKVRKNGNLLLCTLLVGNVGVNVVLPIFMNSISTGLIAGISSIVFITLFGEILPQALCSRYALQIGSATVPIIRVIQFILYPICKPLSMGLDKLLGGEMRTIYSKDELTAIIDEHEEDDNSAIDDDERKIMQGALKFSEMVVSDVMTPMKNVHRYYEDATITPLIIEEIKSTGHTRIPILDLHGQKVVGVLLVKELLGQSNDIKLLSLANAPMLVLNTTKLDEVFNTFKTNRQHMMVVVDEYNNTLGIITLEDVIEEIMGVEILDETDKWVDMRKMETEVKPNI